MAKYRKKPVVVEAKRLTTWEDAIEIFNWLDRNKVPASLRTYDQTIVIDTLEGEMTTRVGDYIIKGFAGEFYPCKPDIFEATYDEVSDEV